MGESATVSVCFNDPNEDDLLTFATTSSDPGVATAVGAGSAVTVTAVSPGTAVVTMVATDPGGLTAQLSFRVMVPNRPPAPTGAIADRELMVGDTVVLDVAPYFSEPDGQPLEFSAASADSTRVAAVLRDATLTVAGLAKGAVAVAVTATDPGGLTAVQSFQVRVPNRAPVAVDSISARTVEVDRADTLDVSAFFADPDGDTLSYAAVSSDSARVAATVAGSALTVAALAKGDVRVTVVATDDEGASAEQAFQVTIPNRAPTATDTIPDVSRYKGEADTLDLGRHFADPDGDMLAFAATSSDSGAVTVSVSASGGSLVVAAVSQGGAEVTVTATDGDGASAQQVFQVTVPNRAPTPTDSLPDLTRYKGEADTLDLAMHFADPDGDPLAFAATSSDSEAVAVAISAGRGALVVAAVAQGGAEVTVTATDGNGASAQQSFQVTVPNRAPTATESIPDLTLHKGEADSLDLALHFADPDGDAMSFAAVSSDSGAVTVAVSAAGGALVVTGVSQGGAEVAVTATDGDGASAQQSFRVTVPNRAPTATDSLPDISLHRGEADTLDLGRHFADPDGDSLSFAATSSDSGAVTVAVSAASGTLVVTAFSLGHAEVTVTATDGDGASAQQAFQVTVPNRAPRATDSIPDLALHKGEADTLDLARHFADPDGDALSFAATSDVDAVAVSERAGALFVVAVSQGGASVAVTATDGDGASAQQTFRVTVPNRAPAATDSIPDLALHKGEADTLDLGQHFADPDGDSLSYAATTSDSTSVTVSERGGVLTVAAVSQGGASVAITATDAGGASAQQTFQVTAANRAPTAKDSIPDLALHRGQADTLDLGSHFADPDGDPLTFAATTSNPGAVGVSEHGGALVVSAVSQGSARVTVTATDGAGASAQQAFQVRVANRAPVPDRTLRSQTLFKRDSVQLDLAPHFVDPDGDRLTHTAESTNDNVVAASVERGTLTLWAGARTGRARITVIATDPGGLSSEQRFTASVRNGAPVATAPIRDVTLTEGSRHEFNASRHFEDPDGDLLTYSATSSNTGVAGLGVSGSEVTVRAVGTGEAEITVSATDPDDDSAAQSFTVTVTPRPPSSGFDIAVGFHSSVGSSLQAAVGGAVSYWESALRATEFQDVPVDSLACFGLNVTVESGSIDDLAIVFLADPIDGARGTLAVAGPCVSRSADRTPLLGLVVFDDADVDLLAQSGNLEETALHEIAHVLGIGPWGDGSLLRNPSYADSTADTHFAGSRAIAAFNAAGGSGYIGGKVPVQSGGDDAHWRESVFGAELMTPSVTLGTTTPLSAITLQALADLGYRVDASYAQAYRLPTPAPGAAAVEDREVLDFGNDVLRGPIQVLDRNGNVVDVIGFEAAPADAASPIRAGPAIRVVVREER